MGEVSCTTHRAQPQTPLADIPPTQALSLVPLWWRGAEELAQPQRPLSPWPNPEVLPIPDPTLTLANLFPLLRRMTSLAFALKAVDSQIQRCLAEQKLAC